MYNVKSRVPETVQIFFMSIREYIEKFMFFICFSVLHVDMKLLCYFVRTTRKDYALLQQLYDLRALPQSLSKSTRYFNHWEVQKREKLLWKRFIFLFSDINHTKKRPD